MARDTQKALVYAWEKQFCPGYWTTNPVEIPEVRALIRKVHADVLAAGGFAHDAPVVKFTKRSGSACASWGILKFTPGKHTLEVVLHEIAHSLTWNHVTMTLALRSNSTDPLMQHARKLFCRMGHGPRYMACFIALLEHYAGRSVDAALALARDFNYQAPGPWRIVSQKADGGSRTTYMRQREMVTKRGRVQVDMAALAYWRDLLKGV
jgi:hypothetical protein